MCVGVGVFDRESCKREKVSKRGLKKREMKRERESVCLCVCERERERGIFCMIDKDQMIKIFKKE